MDGGASEIDPRVTDALSTEWFRCRGPDRHIHMHVYRYIYMCMI